MAEKEVTIRQHEVLRVPQGWTEQDKALVIQLNRIFDDIYKYYGRLTINDLGAALRALLQTMQDDIAQNASDIDDLEEDVSDIEGDISDLQGDMSTAQGNITTLQGQMSTAQGNISTLQGQMSTAQGNISTLQGQMSTAQGNISTLQGQMTTAQGDISGLKTNTLTDAAWSTNKLTKTKNGVTTDIVTASEIQSALPAFTWGRLKGS